jgi:PPOX class probable F420-dependent enzyme
VWIAPASDGTDRLVVISVDGTGKTKRLAHTSRVELRACDVRGRVRDATPTYRGEAVVVRDAEGVATARRALVAKYGLPARFSDLVSSVTSRLGIHRAPRAAILVDVEREPMAAGDVTG